MLAWVAALVAIIALAPSLAGEFSADYDTPGSDSQRASELVAERFPGTSGDTIDVVWQSAAGVGSADIEQRMDRFLDRAAGLEGLGEAEQPRVSEDGTIAVARIELDRRAWDVPIETGEELIERAEQAGGDGLRVELGGGPIQEAQEGGSPESAGLIGAAVVLLIAFGSIVAAGLPILIAIFGLGISTALVGVAAAMVDVPEWATAISGLIGIGVGIDYALLVLTRFRSSLAEGLGVGEAVVNAQVTAGRSVLVAGTTVVISLLGLFLMGVSYMQGVAVAASMSVLVVMAASITLLPALLALIGTRVNKLRLPGLGRAARTGSEPLAGRWSRAVQRRPWTAAITGTAVLLALAAPVLGLRLGFPDSGNDRAGTTTRAAFDLTEKGFGAGANAPLLLVADLGEEGGSQATRELGVLRERVAADGDVAFVSPPRQSPGGDAALLTVLPRSAPQTEATTDLLHRLRDDLVPGALAGSDTEAYVGGLSASVLDQSEQAAGRLPLFIGAVVGLSFLLLLAAFRSPLIALKAGVMNLLSVGAAYGVVALVAEGGFFGGLLGIDTDVPVPPFIPVIMFAILFGLSMDYEVFLLSRVREAFLGHRETSRAVTDGLAKTARVITAAAAIMVVVFLSFVFSTEVFLKLMGVGMAAAVFVDATIVRMVLVPAVMQLMGRGNWWIPGWLDRALPRLDAEPPTPARSPA